MTNVNIHNELVDRQSRFLNALLVCRTIKEAADEAGVSKATAYRYLKDEKFLGKYRDVKSQIMRSTSNKVQLSAETAITTLVDVAKNGRNEMARVTAASKILDIAYTSYEKEDLENRIQAIEQMAIEANKER